MMGTPWERLGLNHKPYRIEDIHSAYEAQKEVLGRNGDPMGQLSLEDAYLNALALWEKEGDYCEKAVKTDYIFDELVAKRAKTKPLTPSELQDIGTHIIRTLHNPWKRNSIDCWKRVFEIDPIDCPSDRQFENLLREALLLYFGYYEDISGKRNKSGGPRLMHPKTAQYIFSKAKWRSNRRSNSEKERHELNWLREELDVGASSVELISAGVRDFSIVACTLLIVLVLYFKFFAWLKV